MSAVRSSIGRRVQSGYECQFRFSKSPFQKVALVSLFLWFRRVFKSVGPTMRNGRWSGLFPRSPVMVTLLDAIRACPELLQECGMLGLIHYFDGFALVQTGRIFGNGALYPCNLLAASTLVRISLVGAFNLGAVLMQVGFLLSGRNRHQSIAVEWAERTCASRWLARVLRFGNASTRIGSWYTSSIWPCRRCASTLSRCGPKPMSPHQP